MTTCKKENVQDIASAVSPAGPNCAKRNLFIRRDTCLRAERNHAHYHFLNIVCRNLILTAIRRLTTLVPRLQANRKSSEKCPTIFVIKYDVMTHIIIKHVTFVHRAEFIFLQHLIFCAFYFFLHTARGALSVKRILWIFLKQP